MAISKKLETAISQQINREIYSAYLYLSMAEYFTSQNLKGFANWMRIQYMEETFHALKFYDFVLARGGRVELKNIEPPKNPWKNAQEVLAETLQHEIEVTKMINNLMKIAREEVDYASETFLQWYVSEQVEEEANASEILEKLKLVGDQIQGVLFLDKELSARVLSPTINLLNTTGAAG